MTKKISKEEIRSQIKKEYKVADRFVKQDFHNRYYKIRIDVSDCEIWSDVYADNESFDRYKSDTIHTLSSEAYIDGKVNTIEESYVQDAIRLLDEAGWEIA